MGGCREAKMTDDRVEGAVKKGAGKMQDAWGGLTGDGETQAKGKANEAAGSVQDIVGQAKSRAQDAYGDVESYAREQPVIALAVTLGVGFILGFVLRGDGRR